MPDRIARLPEPFEGSVFNDEVVERHGYGVLGLAAAGAAAAGAAA